MDTKQILKKTWSLIWRYRVLCLLGALLATGVVLVAAKDARLTGVYRLEQLAQFKDDMFPADARLAKAYRLEELARIKDDIFPADPHLTQPSTQAYLTANPELALARRYTAAPKQISNQAFLAANPELILARRYASMKILAESAFLAANPELLLARRFAKDVERRNELEYLAANPEVALARRIMSDQSGK